MKKFAALFVASAAFTALSASAAQAQTGSCPDGVGGTRAIGVTACVHTHTLSSTVNDILLLTVTSSTPNATALGTPTSVNYAALAAIGSVTPLAATTSPNVKVVANRAFQVSIAAATSTFGPTGVNKPASEVEWAQSDASSTFLGLAIAGAPVMSGIGTTDTNRNLTFRSRWVFERDVPGTYTLAVTLTLAAN